MSEDRPGPSPRTPSEPMAFTRDELLHGAMAAWIAFSALLFGATTTLLLLQSPGAAWLAPLAGLLAVLIGGAVFGILMPFGALIAWGIGHALRRTRQRGVHLLAFTALGAIVGFAYVALLRGTHVGEPLQAWDLLMITPAVAVTLAIPTGWAIAARSALHGTRSTVGRTDHDADFEDAHASDGQPEQP